MIRVGKSARKGRGIFATRKIVCNEMIEEAPVIVVPREQVAHLEATALDDYYFDWGADEEEAALMLGRCSLCNHSYEPNAQFVLYPKRRTIGFIALRHIAAGEEITVNYNGDPASHKRLWFPARP